MMCTAVCGGEKVVPVQVLYVPMWLYGPTFVSVCSLSLSLARSPYLHIFYGFAAHKAISSAKVDQLQNIGARSQNYRM